MSARWVTACASMALLAVAATGQAETATPYAGQQDRKIKALDPGFAKGLREGAGLGFAKSAELNGWPGPLHVLELANALNLSDAQLTQVTAIREDMLAKAIPLGEALIAAERRLEQLFDDTPDRNDLEQATSEIGALRAQLRTVHLDAHLKTAPLLSRHQTMIYARERGYADARSDHHHGGAHK